MGTRGRSSTFSIPMIFVPEAIVFTILGAGFGMYGYLPALMDLRSKVVLPLRYRSVLAGRPELAQYVQKIVWSSDVEDALAKSSAAIVALRPVDQVFDTASCEMSNLRRLIWKSRSHRKLSWLRHCLKWSRAPESATGSAIRFASHLGHVSSR